MKNKNKGFTLIELLVVVAIIGILAAVGTVAYTGYTASAKKSASKSNHANVVKYVAAEMAKCNIELKAFDTWDCSNKSSVDAADNPAKAAEVALSDFKDPYGVATSAVTSAVVTGGVDAVFTASTTKGITLVSTSGLSMQVSTCVADACTEAAGNLMTNAVAID